MKFKISLPDAINKIYEAFKINNKKLYVVGGSVRDALLDMVPKDFDLATDATPEEVENILKNSNIKSFPKGESFGVISAMIEGEEYEIATFREESYEGGDGRRPTSVKFSDIIGDVKRRDLTLNALYYDIKEEKIIDLVGGIDDIKNKRIKPVGSSFDRFREDKLRVLRAIRFSNRFGSDLDSETQKAIHEFKELEGVSNERIRDEFLKGLKSSVNPEKFLSDYKNFFLFKRMFGNLKLDFNFIPEEKDPIIVISKMLLHNNPEDVFKSLTNLTASSTEKDNIKFLHNLYKRFVDFDKNSFFPETDGIWIDGLAKQRDINNINDKVKTWSKINKLDQNIVNIFLIYKPQYSAKDFPEITGVCLGKAIKAKNAEYFFNSL